MKGLHGTVLVLVFSYPNSTVHMSAGVRAGGPGEAPFLFASVFLKVMSCVDLTTAQMFSQHQLEDKVDMLLYHGH